MTAALRMGTAIQMPRPRYADDRVAMLGDIVSCPEAIYGPVGQVWGMRYVPRPEGSVEVWLSLHFDECQFATSNEVINARDLTLIERLGEGG